MTEVTLKVLIIFLLLIANGIFAMAEIAILSARRVRLEHKAKAGNRNARTALDLASAPTQFLSTVQFGITLIGILTGALGGATITEKLAALLRQVPWLAPQSEIISLGIVVLAITYFSLIIGELVPKRLALHAPEQIAITVATPMHALSVVAAPIVHLLSLSTDTVLRLLGIQPTRESPVTAEEIRLLMEQGTRAGTFEPSEHDMVRQVFRLGDRRVSSLMVPRPDLVWLNVDDPLEVNQRKIIASEYSHLLVCRDNLENVLGIVHVKDLLAQCLAGSPIDLTANLIAPVFVPEAMPILEVLERFKQSGNPIALTIDEYGTIQGLVTSNDIFKAIVGEIPTLGETSTPAIVQREDGSWLLDGMLSLDQVKDTLHIASLPNERKLAFETLGGFVMAFLGRIPVAADHFEWGNLRFEVVDMDGNRVDKVLVAFIKNNAPENTPLTPKREI